jgi:hypothetical protein
MPMTAFDPMIHGFRFPNRFLNSVARLPNGATIRTSGRCGGMAFASLDIFHDGKQAPTDDWSAFPRGVPPDGTPLADYLFRRLMNSFIEASAVRFLAWTLLPDERTFIFKGVTAWTADEIPGLRASIDAGRPVALGLVGARHMSEVGKSNHQAVAFGYEVVRGGIDLAVYDNNTPRATVTLSWRKGVDGVAATNRGTPWRGLFAHAYAPVIPPKSIWQVPPPLENDQARRPPAKA